MNSSKEIRLLKGKVKELEDENKNFELRLYMALESILQDKRAFYEPGTTIFRLKEGEFINEIFQSPFYGCKNTN